MDEIVLKRIAKELQYYATATKSLHLTSIAKAIEQKRGCQIFIEPLLDEAPYAECDGYVANCEPYILLDTHSGIPRKHELVQHFIFYRSDPDVEVEQFRVAHELGHCAIHWPLKQRKENRRFMQIPGIGRGYVVEFTKEEEQEADAFACVLGYHAPPVTREYFMAINEGVLKKVGEYKSKGLLQYLKYKN